MKIFISWSGDKAKHVAEALRTWLPTVLAGAVECFVSSQDIRRGERGMDVIAGELQDRDFGVVILTKDNVNSPWINFEAGALGKSLGAGRVAPLLLDITRVDVEGPIAQFQSTLLTSRDDMRQFIRDLAAFAPNVPEASVDTLFDAKWSELDEVIERAAGMESAKTSRSVQSMLEEVLERVRSLERASATVERDPFTPTGNEISKAIIRCLQRRGNDRVSFDWKQYRENRLVIVDTGSTAVDFSGSRLQDVADEWDVRIVLMPHDVVFTPRHRFRDPLAFAQHSTVDGQDVIARGEESPGQAK